LKVDGIHDIVISGAFKRIDERVRDDNMNVVKVQIVSKREYPCRSKVWDMNTGILHKRCSDARLALRVLQIETKKVTCLGLRIDRISKKLESLKACFSSKVVETEATHFDGAVPDGCRDLTREMHFLEHRLKNPRLDSRKCFFIDRKGGQTVSHRWNIDRPMENACVRRCDPGRKKSTSKGVGFFLEKLEMVRKVAERIQEYS
jgi:hypothetical protein